MTPDEAKERLAKIRRHRDRPGDVWIRGEGEEREWPENHLQVINVGPDEQYMMDDGAWWHVFELLDEGYEPKEYRD